MGVGLFVLAVLGAVLANTLGLTGLTTSDEGAWTRVTATVSASVPCTAASVSERVTFTERGREQEARFDGCGHAKGERVDVSVPAGASGGNLVVRSARAATGESEPGQDVGSLLMVVASAAGAGYAYLLRRIPRTPRSAPRFAG